MVALLPNIELQSIKYMRDILINQQKTISKIPEAIINLARMFKNKYFNRNYSQNRRMIENLNRLSQTRQKIAQLQQRLEKLKAQIKDQNEQIKTSDESDSTTLSKSRNQDSFDAKDEQAKQHEQVSERIGEECNLVTDQQSKELQSSETLENQESTKKISDLIKSKQLIQKQFLVQARFIQNALRKRISVKLKLLQIEELLTEKLQRECQNDPQLWETCSGILYEIFESYNTQSENEEAPSKVHQSEESEKQEKPEQKMKRVEWLS